MNTQRPTPGTALITGAAKRIGKAIALHLASLGYNIALHYNRSQEEANAVRKEVKELGVQCSMHRCDLANIIQAEKLVGAVAKQHPNLSVLINNASVFEPSTVKKATTVMLRKHFSINFDAPFVLTQQFANHCSKGHIINILDTHIAQNTTKHATYLLTKKALHALTQVSAAELAPNIRVNAVAPGLIIPPEGKGEDHLERLATQIPMRCKGDIKQIVKSVEFLLNNAYIIGETIFVDGGEHLIQR